MKDLSEKNFLLIILFWFIITFIIMWFFGGACLSFFVAPSNVSSVCLSSSGLAGLKNIPLIGLFFPFTQWVSLFYWFAPVAGFFLAIYAMRWWNDYFDTKEAFSIFFPLILIVFLLLGNFLTIYWYYSNVTAPSSQGVQYGLHFCLDNNPQTCNETVNAINQEYIAQFQRTGGILNQLIAIDYWAELKGNIFLTFVFGAIAAWVPFFARKKFFAKK